MELHLKQTNKIFNIHILKHTLQLLPVNLLLYNKTLDNNTSEPILDGIVPMYTQLNYCIHHLPIAQHLPTIQTITIQI